MARPFQITGGVKVTFVAALLLTALPLAAQDQPAAPVTTPPVIGTGDAPALPGSAPVESEASPTLPGAESTGPAITAPDSGSVETAPAAPAQTTGTETEGAPAGATTDAATGTIGEVIPGAEGAGPAGQPGEFGRPHRGGGHRGGPDGGPDGGPGHGEGQPGGPAASTLPHDLSPWGMYMAADIIVKAVMIILAAAAFVTLTILVYKSFELAFAKRSVRRAQKVIHDAISLSRAAASLNGRRDPAAFMVLAALDELKKSAPALDIAGTDGVKERTSSIIGRTEAQAGRRLARGTGLLATIGSVSPFVGLFGTVWGILNAFIGISKAQTTNLAVVAPGIAEALLATAIGLVAAIPAVIVYNHFSRQIQGYRQQLGDAGAGVERLLSRDLDFRHVPVAE